MKMPKQIRRDPETALHIAVWNLYQRRAMPRTIGFHVPNGGKRSFREAEEFSLMGLVAGVPDLVFIRGDGKAFFLELKAPKGRLSEDQEEFRQRVLNTECEWALVRSESEAAAVLREWKIITPA